MGLVTNNGFQTLSKVKDLINKFDIVFKNLPKTDLYYKDKLKDELMLLYKNIVLLGECENIVSCNKYKQEIRGSTSLIDYFIDRYLSLNYLSTKQAKPLAFRLEEINKMSNALYNSKKKILSDKRG
jgi:hypothetical protein